MSKAIVVALAMLASASALQAPKTLRASANGPRFTTAVPAETDVAVAVEKPEAEAAVVVGEAPTAAAWRAACDADGVMSYADFGVQLGAPAPTAAAWRAACDASGVTSYADFGVRLAA